MSPTEREALMALGRRVRVLRVARGLTQTELGDAAGLDRMSVTCVECARRVPSFITLRRLAHGLAVPLVELLSEPDWPVPKPLSNGSRENGVDHVA